MMIKIKQKTISLFFLIQIVFSFINLDAQNLLINGNFEAQSISSPIFSYPSSNPSAIFGWTTINDGNMGCNIALFGTGMGLGIYQGFNAVNLQNGSNDSGNEICEGTPTTGGAVTAVSLELLATEICNNGIDDDGDGLIDCADPGCALASNCSSCGSSTHSTNWQWLTPESGFNRALAFKYTGADQHFTVPAGVSSIKIKAWGAGGGGDVRPSPTPLANSSAVYSIIGGVGGYTSGTIPVTFGATYSIVVGQAYNYNSDALALPNRYYGGGGNGSLGLTADGAGGGLSGFFLGSEPIIFNAEGQSRALLIAGGGGGATSNGFDTYDCWGGNGNNSTAGGYFPLIGINDSISFNGIGGGGGGYTGGRHHNRQGSSSPTGGGEGGTSYIHTSVIGAVVVGQPDKSFAVPNQADIHYEAGVARAGGANISGVRYQRPAPYLPLTAIDYNMISGGNGYIVLQWNEPLPTNTTSTANICINQTKFLTGSPTGGSWSIVNGGGSIIDTIYTPTSPGNKTIRYSVNGCSKDVTFSVNALPTLSGSTSVCEGNVANVTPSSDGTWISSNPNVASVINSGVITGVGKGSVTLTYIQTTTGCTNTKVINVNQRPAPPIIGAITQPKCNTSGSVILNGLPNGNWTITSTPTGFNQSGNTPSTIISGLPANSNFTFSVIDSNLCMSQTSTNLVIGPISNPPQNRTIDLGPNLSICRADSHRINLQILAGDKIRWNDGNTDTLRTIITPGTYSVSITTAEDCVLFDSIVISRSYDKIPKDIIIDHCENKPYIYKGKNYNTGQTIIDSLNASKGCDTLLTIRLRGIPGTIIYKDTSTCQNTPIKLNNTTYQVGDTIKLIKSSATGCDTSIKMVYRLNPNELKVNMSMDIKGSIGQTITIPYKSSGGIIDNIIFNPTSDINRKADSIIVSIIGKRTYSITFVNEHGCSVTKTLTIDLDLAPLLPNIVTLQSNNPENALFYLKTEGVTYDMCIYDRWGNLIYNSPNNIGGDASKAWHPLKLKVVQGVYVYLVSVHTDNGIIHYSGTVTVL